jgi:hypothetical protein
VTAQQSHEIRGQVLDPSALRQWTRDRLAGGQRWLCHHPEDVPGEPDVIIEIERPFYNGARDQYLVPIRSFCLLHDGGRVELIAMASLPSWFRPRACEFDRRHIPSSEFLELMVTGRADLYCGTI